MVGGSSTACPNPGRQLGGSAGGLHEIRHEQELDALHEIAQILGSDRSQREKLGQTLATLEARLGMRRGTIMLLSADGSRLKVEAAQEAEGGAAGEAVYLRGEGITGRVLETGVPAIVPRISAEPQFQSRVHRRAGSPIELSFICVPITVGREVVGTLSVDLPYDEMASLEEDRRVLAIVSGMIAHDVKARRDAELERQLLEAENLRLRSQLQEQFQPENMVGNSRAMREVYARIDQVAGSSTTVLIRGESGTGKELVARAIHYRSPRADRPFVAVSAAALNENLLESELFGHERGAFTGAVQTRIGRIEEAEGGTLFLDEIGELPPGIQVKLLRVLQEREYSRVGSNRIRRADVRIIAATNRDLEAAVEARSFRLDLYYRINVFTVWLPPLRERKDDILPLADHFVERYARKLGKRIERISTSAINMLFAYHWPGNVRELENCIQHAVLLSQDGVIHGHHLPPTLQMPPGPDQAVPGSLKSRVTVLERDLITDALKRHGGNVAAAARELGTTPRIVRYRMRKLGIEEHLFRRPKKSR